MRVNANFAGGLISNDPLSSSGLTLSSPGLAALPGIYGNGDYIPIVLDPDGIFGAPEVAYIVEHVPYSTQATLADNGEATPGRMSYEGSTAREHAAGVSWINSPTVIDINCRQDIDVPGITVNNVDDDFSNASLADKWSVISGTFSEVSLTGSSSGIYDLTSSSNRLLVQPGNGNNVYLRQDVELADGESAIMSVRPSFSFGVDTFNDNSFAVGIILNDNDSSPTSKQNATRVSVLVEATSALGWYVGAYGDTVASGRTGPTTLPPDRVFLRVSKDGLYYHAFWSMNGIAWNILGEPVLSVVPNDNIWLYFKASGSVTPAPIIAVDWVRIGSNSIAPW